MLVGDELDQLFGDEQSAASMTLPNFRSTFAVVPSSDSSTIQSSWHRSVADSTISLHGLDRGL